MAGLVDFTNEEEVKEFLNNTEIEFMYGCHREHNEDSCYRLGEFLETIRKKFSEAAKVYKNCCDTFQNATCCYKAAHFHMLGRGGLEKSETEAFKCYRTACEQNNYADQGKNDRIAAACCNVGLMLMSNTEVRSNILSQEKDAKNQGSDETYWEIKKAYERACNLKDRVGCNLLSQLYMSGFDGKHMNMKESARYAELSCDLGEAKACHNLNIMYRRGDGVEKNNSKAAVYAKKRDEIIKGQLSLSFSEH